MKLTTRGRYAVTAMLDLALHAASGPISLSDIAQRQAISLSYLEQLFAKLKRAGLVASSRGPGGGYVLGHGVDAISVAAVVDAVDEHIDATRCGGSGNCQEGETCLTHALWADLSQRIGGYLSSISLGDLTARSTVANIAQRQDALQRTRALRDAHGDCGRDTELQLIDTRSLNSLSGAK